MKDVTKDIWNTDNEIDTYDTLPNWLALFEAINHTSLSPDKIMKEHNLFDTDYTHHITEADNSWRTFWEEECCVHDRHQKRIMSRKLVQNHLYKYQWLLKFIAEQHNTVYKNLMIKFEEMNEGELIRPPRGRRKKDTTE